MTILKFIKKDNLNQIRKSSLKNSTLTKINCNKKFIFFSRLELTSILNLYSKQVSKGFWKDYALDSKPDTAIFSIYKHSHDKPIYQIIKKSIKSFRNIPDFFVKKDSEVINKSKELSILLSRFEKKLSITKHK